MTSSSQPVLPPINSPPPLDIPNLSAAVPSPETVKDTIRPSRPVHTNVLARLQALFPSAPHAQSHLSTSPSDSSPLPPLPPEPLPKSVKVRILTWNMHDSLPKGDVEELLGSVPANIPSLPHSSDEHLTLPVFGPSPDHPYHIVIVAGQECPSASGIPMALGAGFKLNNKDNSRSRHSLLPQDADESIHRKSGEFELLSPTLDKNYEHNHPPSSWSSILESWYCHPTGEAPTTIASDPNIKTMHESQRVGPYELLIKERMMGLYLAVFIHREARPFVRGTSKSAVTTGLIGGRVGNKGGVGVSINLDGTTLLFVNAHLAAHEGKVHHRLADLAKIKAELSVDDFLSPNDSRFMAEDITDRFDFTFICGDLNFRLDITRLHADWLITRKEYEQALEFDQLRKVMATGDSFAGFSEAQIRFPPTFKYDVLRTIRRSRTKSSKRPPATPTIVMPHQKVLSEVVEHGQEHAAEEDRASQQDDDDVEPDGASVTSSAWTSVRSRRIVDPDEDLDDEPDTERDPSSARFFIQSPPASASTTKLMHKVWTAAAAHRAKEKWVALFNPKSPKVPFPHPNAKHNGNKRWRQSWASAKSPGPPRRASQPATGEFPPETTSIDPADPRQTRAGRTREFQAALLDAMDARPHRHLALSVNNVDLEEEDKGVYDSSHKQRVPSWCDRILWKSTVVPDSDMDSDDGESQRFMPLRAKMGQIFHALRPSSLRSRRDSTWSLNHPDLSQTTPSNEQTSHRIHLSPSYNRQTLATQASSPTRVKVLPLRRVSQTRSVDSFQRSSSSEDRSLTRTQSLTRTHSHEVRTSLVPPSGRGVPLRHANTISPVMPVGDTSSTTLVSSPISPSSPLDIVSTTHASSSPSAPMFRWLLPFFHRDGPQQQATQPDLLGTACPKPEPPPPRRGDVVCLGYDTLDDRGMRRLEGRSDHRPVIGSYVVYI